MGYGCVVEIPPGGGVPADWTVLSVPVARYAIFSYGGSVAELPRAETWILDDWLPASGLVKATGFVEGVELVERYGPRFDPRTRTGDVEIWLPIEG